MVMTDTQSAAQIARADEAQEDFGHPRGTLAIVIVFAILFLLAWFGMYIYLFLGRGAPHS
jgi:hypothetical protein